MDSQQTEKTPTLEPVTLLNSTALLTLIQEFNGFEKITTPLSRIQPALEKLILSPQLGRTWFIKQGIDTVGYAILTFGYDLEYGGRDAWITDIYVRPVFREQGLGSLVMPLIEKEAKNNGVSTLHLVVRRENQRARRVYEKSGFKENPRMAMIKILTG